MSEKNDQLPKLKLRRGLRPTNVTIHRDGKTFTERVEPGKVYCGEEYHTWVPRILVPVDPTVKVESLKVPEPPPHRRGLRRMRRILSPEKPAGVRVKAVMKKKHEEEPAPKTEASAPAAPPSEAEKPKPKRKPKKAAPKKKAAKKAKTKRRSR